MSREVRRVPLDFDFPLHQTWSGYLQPEEIQLPECSDCCGSGETWAGRWLDSVATLLLLLGEDAADEQRGRPLHPYLGHLENHPMSYVDGRRVVGRPTGAVELSTGLAGRPPGSWGHDVIDRWTASKKILAAAGLPENWGWCSTCNGSGAVGTPEQHAANEAWEATEPPTGDGFQLWQTVSEGGPVSPVFGTADALADWIINVGSRNDGSWTPRDKLIAWIERDGHSAGSFAFVDGRMVSGVEIAAGEHTP